MGEGDIARPPPEALFDLRTDVWTAPYWEAMRAHVLQVPACGACGHMRMPPTPFCPRCRSQALRWVPLSGRGTIYSYTLVQRAVVPEMEGSLPYVPALIEPEEAPGVRIISNLVDMALGDIAVGRAVKLRWVERSDGQPLACFALA